METTKKCGKINPDEPSGQKGLRYLMYQGAPGSLFPTPYLLNTLKISSPNLVFCSVAYSLPGRHTAGTYLTQSQHVSDTQSARTVSDTQSTRPSILISSHCSLPGRHTADTYLTQPLLQTDVQSTHIIFPVYSCLGGVTHPQLRRK